MFIWICLYFSIRWWPSLLHIISWLCPWCQVTQWVTAEQLPAVASEKACDWHLLSGMKKRVSSHWRWLSNASLLLVTKQTGTLLSVLQPFTVRGFKESLHEPNGRSNLSLYRLRVFLSAHFYNPMLDETCSFTPWWVRIWKSMKQLNHFSSFQLNNIQNWWEGGGYWRPATHSYFKQHIVIQLLEIWDLNIGSG